MTTNEKEEAPTAETAPPAPRAEPLDRTAENVIESARRRSGRNLSITLPLSTHETTSQEEGGSPDTPSETQGKETDQPLTNAVARWRKRTGRNLSFILPKDEHER